MTIINIATKDEFESLIRSNGITVIHFYAPWAAQCDTMNGVLEELAKQNEYTSVKFCKCEAEELSEVSLLHKVQAVPTILIFNDGKLADTINGANAAELTTKLNKVVGNGTTTSDNKESLEDRLKALINKSPVMVFMKGNPQQPRCGFSKTLMAILNETKIPFDTFDILLDEEVRQGLKTYSSWPTYPQIYVKGELIGGLDIIQELKQENELVATLRGA